MAGQISWVPAPTSLRMAGRRVLHPEMTIAVADHNVPTENRKAGVAGIADQASRDQVEALERNVAEFGIPYIPLVDQRQGIVHVIGPELGLTLPGTTVVCGDSHTSTHGAFGALAFGIGTSEAEHVLATQTLIQRPAKTMRVEVSGRLSSRIAAKDLILAIIGRIGTAGATGHVIEYAGSAIEALDVAGRMTVCNMSIEAGARAGMIAPDEKVYAWLRGRRFVPESPAPSPLLKICREKAMGRRFDTLSVIAAPLEEANVDTDKILPAQFLKTVEREGLGRALFYHMRHDAGGAVRPDFVLNQPPWDKAGILVTLDNFGCGSSREHAPWALDDFGIRAIIAPSFADIFRQNCIKNGTLPAIVGVQDLGAILACVSCPETAELAIDLVAHEIHAVDGRAWSFHIDDVSAAALLAGEDEIDLSLRHLDAITRHFAERGPRQSWLRPIAL